MDDRRRTTRRRRTRLGAVLTTAAAVAAVAGTALALEPTPAPTPTHLEERSGMSDGVLVTTHIEANFAEPNRLPAQSDGVFRDPKVKDRLIELIREVPQRPGEEISIAFHSLGFPSVVDALADAQEAGVKVDVVFDGRKRSESGDGGSGELRRRLEAARTSAANTTATRGSFHYCNNGDDPNTSAFENGACISQSRERTGGDMHAKYALFSNTRDSSDTPRSKAVWISSANMTPTTGTETYNNAVVVYGTVSFYGELKNRIFNRAMLRDWQGTDYLDLTAATDTRGYAEGDTANVAAWASPDGGADDPVLNQLGKVNAVSGCDIRVMQSQFRGPRAASIARRLRELSIPGGEGGAGRCDVQVLVGDTDPDNPQAQPAIDAAVMDQLCKSTHPARLRYYPRLHDKVMLVDAPYGSGTAFSKIVYAGSHNFTTQAHLDNDELLLKVGSNPGGTGVYTAFLQHFTNANQAGNAQPGAPTATGISGSGCPT